MFRVEKYRDHFCADNMKKKLIMTVAIAAITSVCAWGQMRPVVVDSVVGMDNTIGMDSDAIEVNMPDLAVEDSMFGVMPKQQNISLLEKENDSLPRHEDVSLLGKVENWY